MCVSVFRFFNKHTIVYEKKRRFFFLSNYKTMLNSLKAEENGLKEGEKKGFTSNGSLSSRRKRRKYSESQIHNTIHIKKPFLLFLLNTTGYGFLFLPLTWPLATIVKGQCSIRLITAVRKNAEQRLCRREQRSIHNNRTTIVPVISAKMQQKVLK